MNKTIPLVGKAMGLIHERGYLSAPGFFWEASLSVQCYDCQAARPHSH